MFEQTSKSVNNLRISVAVSFLEKSNCPFLFRIISIIALKIAFDKTCIHASFSVVSRLGHTPNIHTLYVCIHTLYVYTFTHIVLINTNTLIGDPTLNFLTIMLLKISIISESSRDRYNKSSSQNYLSLAL